MPPGSAEYSLLRNSRLFTNEPNLKLAEPPKLPSGKAVTADNLILGLRMTCFDRTAKPMDIPPDVRIKGGLKAGAVYFFKEETHEAETQIPNLSGV